MTKHHRKQPTRVQSAEPAFLARLTSLQRDLLCVALLYILTVVVFRGIIFNNAAFSTESDTAASLSYTYAGQKIEQTEGVDAIWMPGFFSGLPTFGNVAFIPHNVSYLQTVVQLAVNLLYLNGRWTWMIVYYLLAGVFMFSLMRTLKFSRPAALLGALMLMMSPHVISLASEGHGSKLMALSYLPLVFLLTHLAFERRSVLTFGLLAAAIGTLLLTNHMQIVYYALIVIGLYLLYNIILDIRSAPKSAAAKTLLLLGALALGFCISSYIYLSVYEYSHFSIRGGGSAGASGGLSWDYATNWSWNPQEMLTLLVPSFFGFHSPYYWGTMPLSNAPIYVGVVSLILSVVALSYRRTRLVIFFAALCLIVFVISFGKHFPVLYQLMFDYLPFFNKFRAPSMILQILPFIVAFIAGAGLDYLLDRDTTTIPETLGRTLLIIAAVFAGMMLLLALTKTSLFQTLSSSMLAKEDELALYRQQYGAKSTQIMAQLKQMRFDMLWKDLVKFVIITVVTLSLVSFYLRRKVSATVFSAAILLIAGVDLFIVVRTGDFISPKPQAELDQKFVPDATTTFLQQQPGLFRVFPLGELFMDNTYAYHGVQSIGGYSPAKLKIYQTLIDSCLYRGAESDFPINMNIVNMLNTGFIMAQGRLPEDRFTLVNVDQAKKIFTYKNLRALPRAFFVREARIARNQTEVFETLNAPSFDAGKTAVLENVSTLQISAPDSASAQVTEYKSRRITVKAYTSSPALMVLSEVYYPAGWKASIDGQETEIFKTNSILRSVVVPAGTHELVFSFDPLFYRAGYLISNIAWVVALLCIAIGLWRTPEFRMLLKKHA
jgi:hypothetical protein